MASARETGSNFEVRRTTTHLVVHRSHGPDDGLRPVREDPLVEAVPGCEGLSAKKYQDTLSSQDAALRNDIKSLEHST